MDFSPVSANAAQRLDLEAILAVFFANLTVGELSILASFRRSSLRAIYQPLRCHSRSTTPHIKVYHLPAPARLRRFPGPSEVTLPLRPINRDTTRRVWIGIARPVSLAIGSETEILKMIMQPGRTTGGSNIRNLSIRSLGFMLTILCGSITGLEARGQEPLPAITLDQLLRMAPTELESVYRQGITAAIPEGRIRGTASFAWNQAGTGVVAGSTAFLAGKGVRARANHRRQSLLWFSGDPRSGLSGSELARRPAGLDSRL